MSTRQQKRAKARAPIKKPRRGLLQYVAIIVALVLGGGLAVGIVARSPQEIERGALANVDHWHARYRIELCGKLLEPFPNNTGEIHTHGDGQIHLHPTTSASQNQNANLGAFLNSVEASIQTSDNGARALYLPAAPGTNTLPDGSRVAYKDGETCPGGDNTEHDVEVLVDGEPIETDPMKYVVHDGEEITIRFGPNVTGDDTIPNPLVPTPAPGGQEQPAEAPAPG